MELQYIILTIIKILISVPAIVLLLGGEADAAALIGGHVNNHNTTNMKSNNTYDFKIDLSEGFSQEIANDTTEAGNSEEIPDPSPLVVPGYNLPGNIFNRGKPFYLEKDPLTGDIDFSSKTSSLKVYDDYEYEDEVPMYDKTAIDRKDGPVGGNHHKPSDINQLTPNFHDFLNLPVKYNPDKYVYPLISSSYANTKVQGNVNKYQHQNHKNYVVTTYKPTLSPTYYTTKYPQKVIEYTTKKKEYTTRQPHLTEVYTTSTKPTVNLMQSPMNHPSFNEEFYSSTPPTTTKRTMSLFEQLFGSSDYEEVTTEATEKPAPPKLFNNLPKKTAPTTTTASNIMSGSNMGYEYEEKTTTKADDEEYEYDYVEKIATTTTTTTTTTEKPSSTRGVTTKVTSLPLGENHVNSNSRQPIMIATQNLREQLNHEKVNTHESEESIEDAEIRFGEPSNSEMANQFGPNKIAEPAVHYNLGANNYNEGSNSGKYDSIAKYDGGEKYEGAPIKFSEGSNQVPESTNKYGEILNKFEEAPQNKFGQNYGTQTQGKFGAEGPVKYGGVVHPQAPSTSNVHIAPDQDTVSFVVGNHQNVDGGNYVGSSIKESPYDSNPFRPVYDLAENKPEVEFYQPTEGEFYIKAENPPRPPISGSNVSIQPIRNSEASLAIGSPINGAHIKPGQVMDDKEESIEFTQGAKIVFPDERQTTTDLSPPPPPPPPQNNREVLKLSSKPMFHQLPSDLTPPSEKETKIPQRIDRVRPPWDPRPGHFHQGRPEYARPPRPSPEIYKRIDNLPNILPQFRPNMKIHHHHPYPPKNYARQPLLDRPSNRPIGFFEKLHPPPPPPPQKLMRKPEMDMKKAEDRISHGGAQSKNGLQEPFAFLQAPPKVIFANRRSGDDPETLQMIQAKKDNVKSSSFKTNLNGKDSIEKPLYVVYPVNTPPLKLDVVDTNKKESVVIGTRAELPLPPSKIVQEKKPSPQPPIVLQPEEPAEFNYEMKDRHDAPILKPRPGAFPIKSDFPYPLERPDPNIYKPESTLLDHVENKLPDEPIISSNQWNTIDHEPRIVNTQSQNNQISVTLKTYTEKPIAVAYTPTETQYSPYPNYGNIVIPEIAHHKLDRVDEETTMSIQDFQAPFHASAHIDHSISQGWAVIREKEDRKDEVTTLPIATTSEFDIENFNPQLEGGFKPIYSYPEEKKDTVMSERQE